VEVGEDDYRAGEIIVRLNESSFINQILAEYALKRIDVELDLNLETEENPIYLVTPTDGRDAKEVANDLEKDIRVDIAEPNYLVGAPEDPEYVDPTTGVARFRARVIQTRTQARKANKTFDEKLNLNATSCVRDTTGARVAVLDTGAQLDHPALRGNIRGVERYDFVDNDSKPTDSRVGLNVDGNRFADQMRGHGTHVAGIVDQVAPGAQIMPLRVLDSEGYGDVYDIARGIAFAQGHGADVINLSLGSSTPSRILEEMIEEAIRDDIVVVAAAGNAGADTPHYPAAGAYRKPEPPLMDVPPLEPSVEGLLAVISVETPLDSWKKSWFANYGYWVDIAAPGEDIRSAYPGDKYAIWSGTSMATPFVSGQAALIHANNSELNPERIEDEIRSSARRIDADNDDAYLLKLGAGHADVCGSLP
jgi:subtilisin family serine protease